MTDYAFYNASGGRARGLGRLFVPFVWLLRRLLLPIFQREAELFAEQDLQLKEARGELDRLRLDFQRLEYEVNTLQALRLDREALSRRMAALEDHVETLLAPGG
jgi:hypothetical protein